MYIYCIAPSGVIIPNFIKIGFCRDFNNLKKRYKTYYGNSNISYHVKVNDKKQEFVIHNELKKMGLHIENELFKYNDEYNYKFYKDMLNELSKKDNKILNNNFIKRQHKVTLGDALYKYYKLLISKENTITEKMNSLNIYESSISKNILNEKVKKIENRKYIIKINYGKHCTDFYNYINENNWNILKYKEELSNISNKNIENISNSEIIEYKIKNINGSKKTRIKNKIIRSLFLYNEYGEKLKNIDFSGKRLVEMSENEWFVMKNELKIIFQNYLL